LVKLSIKNLKNISSTLHKIENKTSSIDDEVCKYVAEKGLEKLEDIYNSGIHNVEKPDMYIEQTSKGYNIVAKGREVVYDEFGEGDIGKSNHTVSPTKYGLQDYNHGLTIRPISSVTSKKFLGFLKSSGITSGNFWTYHDKNGKLIATQGFGSSNFMYNTGKWLHDNYKDLVKKKYGDELRKIH